MGLRQRICMTGRSTANFSTGASEVTIVVSEPNITEYDEVQAWVSGVTPSGRSADELTIEQLRVQCFNVAPGVGFSILVECVHGRAEGIFYIAWRYGRHTTAQL